jgi:Spy/CpxP family protein refolding chaperone
MRPRWYFRLLCAPFLLALAGPIQAQSAPGFAWWRDAQVEKDLGLTADQSNRIDAVFRAALPHQRQKKDELDAQEAELSRLIATDADEVTIGKQSDQVETIRADLNKSRTLMLVHMRQLLSPEQRVKLTMLHEQRKQQRERDHENRDHRAPPRDGAR